MTYRECRRFVPVAIGIASVAAGCGEHGLDAEIGDSILPAVPVLTGQPVLSFGAESGAEELLIGRLGGMAVHPAGHLVFTDMRGHDVRVVSDEGRLLAAGGGEGDGPGELRTPGAVIVDGSGTIWVRHSPDRLTGFIVRGDRLEFLQRIDRDALMESGFEGSTWMGRSGVPSDSGFLALLTPYPLDEGGMKALVGEFELDPLRVRVAERFNLPAEIDEVQIHLVGREHSRPMVRGVPWGGGLAYAISPSGGVARVETRAYLIQRVDRDGSVLSPITGPEIPRIQVTETERRRAEDEFRQFLDAPEVFRFVNEFRVPEFKVPIVRIAYDRDGRLWVELHQPEGSEARVAHVFDERGGLQFVAQWPVDVELFDFGPMVIGTAQGEPSWGVRRNPLGANEIVRLEWQQTDSVGGGADGSP